MNRKDTARERSSGTLVPRPLRCSVERGTLLAAMEQCGQCIFVIRGSVGYGKTELARQYCAGRGGQAAWYSMASADGRLAFPSLENSPAPPDVPVLWENGNSEGMTRILVIDDYSGGEWQARFLDQALEWIGANREAGRLLLLTREGVPDSLACLALSGDCRLVNEEELAFTSDEREELLSRTLGEKAGVFRTAFQECGEWLEGWPAGLSLSLSFLERNGGLGSPADWSYLIQDSMIEGLLNCQVFEKEPREIREFLLRTAPAGRVEETLCERAFGVEGAKPVIKDLLRKNLLIRVPREGPGEYRYRRVFRLFLNEKLWDGDRRKAVRLAADYYLEKNRFGRAVEEALEGDYTELIVKVMGLRGEELLRRGEDAVLGQCVSCLEGRPEFRSADAGAGETGPSPELLGVAAQYYYKTGSWARAEAYLNRADSCFGKENKYGAYRSLYRGLLKYRDDPVKYKKQISEALFVLREKCVSLPYLRGEEQRLLDDIELESGYAGGRRGRLKVTVFGDFQVCVAGEGVSLSWRTKKSRELFAFLIGLNGAPVGRKQLLQTLWSEELPDNAVAMLHNMLYNIRKELAPYQMAELIRYRDKRYSIDMEEIETDLTEKRRVCALVDRKEGAELEKHSRRFLTYWGRYLEDLDCMWCTEAAEYYDARFRSGCVMLAERRMEEGEYQEAAAFLKNALAADPYSEELICRLIRCYAAAKNRKLVKSEFERFRELLKQDLNVQPGKEAEQAYREALTG